MHAFSDASNGAYGAIIYLREFFRSGKPKVKFIMSKAKVAPNKGKWNIHRLELMAAIVSVRLAQTVKEAIGVPIDSTTFWADNSSVIGWTKEKPSAWKTFVANRIAEIQKLSSPDQWRYVSTKDNPADLLSRGSALDSEELSRFWFQGPSWLSEEILPKPIKIGKTDFAEAILEAKKSSDIATVVMSATTSQHDTSHILDEKHFSTWKKAVRLWLWYSSS
jgi:hypothetical protein